MTGYRILLLFFLCWYAILLPAKEVYLIVFTDENDASIGTSCTQTRKYFKNTFVPNIKRYAGLKVIETYGYGNRFTLSYLNNTLSNLQTTQDDVIIFYYAGHGYNRGHNDYPTLTIGNSGSIAMRSKDLLNIYNTLRSKPHQLLLCIAEACNAVHHVSGIADNMVTSFPSHVFSAQHFKTLFNSSGDYMASSSIKGQKSYSASGVPGMFTSGFTEAFNEVVEVSNAGVVTWTSVFSKSIRNTENIAIESGYEQTPQWIKGKYVVDEFTLASVEILGVDKDKNVTCTYPALYDADIAYLRFRIKYSSSKTRKLFFKLSSSGRIYDNDKSPAGYSWSVNLNAGVNKTKTHDWGWETKGNYKPGNYTYKLYDEKKKLVYTKSFSIQRKNVAPSYLTVDNNTSASAFFSASGGTKTFYVNTDGNSFQIDYLPDWCSVTSKGSTSFTIRCSPNSSSSPRNDWFRVKSGNLKVRIDISQRANSNNVTGSIQKIWVEHNVIQTYGFQYIKGMKIHVKFTVNNMLRKTGNIQAYFWFQNGAKLLDYNGLYRAPDGQVSVYESFTPNYQNCEYNYTLFMPYAELHCGTGKYNLMFHVEMFEKTTGVWKSFLRSEYVNFTFTNYF